LSTYFLCDVAFQSLERATVPLKKTPSG
jgi:hypothetical protein